MVSDEDDTYAESQMVHYERPPQLERVLTTSRNGKKGAPCVYMLQQPTWSRYTNSKETSGDDFSAAENPAQNRRRVFQMSGVSDRAAVKQKLASLDCDVLDATSWDAKCTHLIVGKLNRVEKVLGACASGRWVSRCALAEIFDWTACSRGYLQVLKPSYVDACIAAQGFVDEEAFEHSDPAGEFLDGPRRCRLRVSQDPGLAKGIFSRCAAAYPDARVHSHVCSPLALSGLVQDARPGGDAGYASGRYHRQRARERWRHGDRL